MNLALLISQSDSGGAIAVASVLAAIAAFAIWWIYTENKQNRLEREAREAKVLAAAATELQHFLEEADYGNYPNLNDQVEGAILHSGEQCVLKTSGVEQIVAQKNTKYVGG